MNRAILDRIIYLVGDKSIIENMPSISAKEPFVEEVIAFLSDVSKVLMKDTKSKVYSDIVTFAFWIRAASLKRLKEENKCRKKVFRLGRGVVFHIAPSNVPVNFAYSLVSGLLTGNANILRVPSKDFEQVDIIADAIKKVLEMHENMKPYIALVRYERDKSINDELSSIADVRIIWGGDNTINELRKSLIPPRSIEITFADRYSLAIIDSDVYIELKNKKRVAENFYNDTYFSDQNACTSPRVVIWTGKQKERAKGLFWSELYSLVEQRYTFQDIQGVNKLASSYLAAANWKEIKIHKAEDNLIVRVQTKEVDSGLMDYMDNSGFFYEYDCDDVFSLKDILDDKRCQTIGMIGDSKWLNPLIMTGIKGIDRIVNIGNTMDFNLIWDGYDLVASLTRLVYYEG